MSQNKSHLQIYQTCKFLSLFPVGSLLAECISRRYTEKVITEKWQLTVTELIFISDYIILKYSEL